MEVTVKESLCSISNTSREKFITTVTGYGVQLHFLENYLLTLCSEHDTTWILKSHLSTKIPYASIMTATANRFLKFAGVKHPAIHDLRTAIAGPIVGR